MPARSCRRGKDTFDVVVPVGADPPEAAGAIGSVDGAEGGVDEGGVDEGGVDEGGVDEGGVDEGGVDKGGVDEGGVAGVGEDVAPAAEEELVPVASSPRARIAIVTAATSASV